MEGRETDPDLMDIAAAVFHGRVDSRDVNGQYTGEAHKGEKFTSAVTAYPYGFRSYAPLNTGLVLTRSQAGLMLVLSQEGPLPTGVTEPLSGEALLYNAEGAQVLLDENGDVNIVQKSGRFINLGSSPSPAALAKLTDAEFDRIQAAHDTHKHAGCAGNNVPDTLLVTMGDVGATEVKIT